MSVRRGVDAEHSSSIISGALAMVAAVIAVAASGLSSIVALGFGALGLGAIAAGIFALDSRAVVSVGSVLVFFSVVAAGVSGALPELLLVSMIATIVALDLGQNAVSVGRQMTTDTYTRRGEFVHAGASAVVGVLVAGFAYAIYFAAEDGQPAGALVALVLATLLLVWSFRS